MGLLPDTQNCGLRMRRECLERVTDPDMHHGACLTHLSSCLPGSLTRGFLWSRLWGKPYRHSRRMRKPLFCVSGKRPIAGSDIYGLPFVSLWSALCPDLFISLIHCCVYTCCRVQCYNEISVYEVIILHARLMLHYFAYVCSIFRQTKPCSIIVLSPNYIWTSHFEGKI